jgi:hypothetical protein
MTDADDWDETPGSTLEPFPSVRGTSRLLGVNTEGQPVYYDEEAHARRDAATDADADADAADWDDDRPLDDDVTVGDLLDDVEESVGWDELTDYARDHLPGMDADDGDDGGDGTGGDRP